MVLCDEEYASKIDKAIFPGMQGGPLMHVIAGKAVSFKEASTDEFKDYASQIVKNSKKLALVLSEKGLNLVSDGTDNHLILLDLREIGFSGKKAEIALGKAGITVNKNSIPYDTRKPAFTSGVRIGTAAITSRKMKENELELIGNWISDVLEDIEDEVKLSSIRDDVRQLCDRFPMGPLGSRPE